MEVYRTGADDLIRIPETEFEQEATLENHLVKSEGAEIGTVEVMYIGRQGSPEEGGIFDILGLDSAGDVVILELKRDKSPRDIVAQALEYASGIRRETYDQLNDRYQEFVRSEDSSAKEEMLSLREAHERYFDLNDALSEREFNANQRLILVAKDFHSVSLNMADFLREHEIDVVCVEYDAYATEDGAMELVTTDAIRRPLEEEPTGTASDTPEYRNLIFSVRDRIYPELKEILDVDEPDEIQRSGTKQLGFASNDPSHPETVRYGFNPEVEESGTVTVRLNVWGSDDQEKAQVRSVVSEHADGLEPFELTPDYQSSWELLVHEIEVDSQFDHDDLVDQIAEELIELVEYYHPIFVDEVST